VDDRKNVSFFYKQESLSHVFLGGGGFVELVVGFSFSPFFPLEKFFYGALIIFFPSDGKVVFRVHLELYFDAGPLCVPFSPVP